MKLAIQSLWVLKLFAMKITDKWIFIYPWFDILHWYNLGYRIIFNGYIPIFWYLISIGWYLIDIIWYLRQGGKVAGELVVLRTISSQLIKRWLLLEQTGKIFLSTPLHSFTSLLSQRWAKIFDIVKVIFRCLYFDEFNHRPIWLISC